MSKYTCTVYVICFFSQTYIRKRNEEAFQICRNAAIMNSVINI